MSPLRIGLLLSLILFSTSWAIATGEFNAEFQEEFGIKLSWNRNIDTEGNYFILERSPDGVSYTQIAEITKWEEDQEGGYTYQDRRHNIGFNYYRLNLISETGGIMATFLAVEEAYQLTSNLVIYPNPSSGLVRLSTFNTLFEKASIYIYDSIGREVFRKGNITPNDSWSVELDLRFLKPGLYILHYQSDKRLKTNNFPISLFSPE